MAKKLNSVLGVDIGSQKIKIAEVRLQGREPTITALGIADTPEGAVDHTGVYNSDAVGAVLKDLAAGSGATVNQIVVSIAGQASVLVRTLEVPKMNPAELKEHMGWEITRNIPFAESTVESDFKAFESDDPAAQNLDVVMAIAPRSAIDTIVALVKKAGKQTAAIDVEPLSIARSLRTSYAQDLAGLTACVVDIGHKTTSINIYKDGRLLLPRTVPLGGEMITRAIADGLGLSIEEAEQLKRTKAGIPESAAGSIFGGFGGGSTQQFQSYNPFADDPAMMNPSLTPMGMPGDQPTPYSAGEPREDQPVAGAYDEPPAQPAPEELPTTPVPVGVPAEADDPETVRIYNAMASVIEEFVAEVRRSIDYFRSKGGDVDRIELMGGGAKLRGLDAFLSKTLGIPTEVYDPLRNIQVSAKKLDQEIVDQNRQDLAVAIGNALHIAFD
ncbi:MAG TPA: type IV pilus assembly protein PilM [Fimbriimonadaceae bacterium]|nr:type IV pilus assembly protein PilM [Fimbriimonadaceae bacterium]HRJ97484.1 type IV pilus assembly protein PilM [Fimbriimonadaceae bacterium]